ncbi:MAG: YidC/Oxa1 family membrane protein insertase [Lachnospiraceae bacterium]
MTQESGILKPFVWIFGQVFNLLYELLSLVGIENVAVTIVLFTIVTKLLMTPLTIKQQKFSKLSSKMTPELNKIAEKYKNKKDEQSMRMQQLEQQAVYEKYGTNPASGCLPMLITLPIMFALYRVIYAIPAYVDDIYTLYNTVAESLKTVDYFPYMTEVASSVGVSTSKFAEIGENVLTNNHLIDIMTKFGTEQWEALAVQFPSISETINVTFEKLNHIHSIGGFNISNTPAHYGFSLAILIPVLAVATQLLQSKLSMASTNKNKNEENPMAQSMNSMLYIMPFVSGFMCWMFPICIGIYWVASTVVMIISQFFINRHIDHMDLDDMIQKNVEKQNKRKEKMGIEQGTKMAELAKTQTKNINASARGTTATYANAANKDYKTPETKTKSTGGNSISDYANILKK